MSVTDAKHTPGPWVVDRLSGSGRLQVTAPSSHTVATICHNVYIPEEVHAANARLIAAAPEMYEALETLLYEHKPCGGELWRKGNEICECERCDGIRFVLAKARG